MDLERVKEAQSDCMIAERELTQARDAVIVQQRINARLREAFTKALKNFQAAFPIITRESLVRQHVNAEANRRLAINAGLVAPAEQPRCADSVIDRERMPWGGADAQIRKMNRLGSNRGFVDRDGNLRRALPRSMFGRTV